MPVSVSEAVAMRPFCQYCQCQFLRNVTSDIYLIFVKSSEIVVVVVVVASIISRLVFV